MSVMPLMIRNPVAAELARELAGRRNQTMTDVVIDALRNELKREREKRPLAERLSDIADDFLGKSPGLGPEVTKEDMDRMWGHE